MDLFSALNNARDCIEQAENAKTVPTRQRYLKLAKVWLGRADVDAWFKRDEQPAVIMSVEETKIERIAPS